MKLSPFPPLPNQINENPPLTLDSIRVEFQRQIDELKQLILDRSYQVEGIEKEKPNCPSPGKWDATTDRCRGSDGRFIDTQCCDISDNSDGIETKIEYKKPPSYYITLLMNKYKGEYALSSAFHEEVNQGLKDNKIPIISPQQIRIFVNLHGFLTVKMNGLNTYKFIC